MVPMMLQPVWPAYNFRNLYRRKKSKLDQLYNTDKSGSNWQDLPTRALAFERERYAPGYMSSKECLMFMFSGNASGNHKLKL
jgi:hypothetical protein